MNTKDYFKDMYTDFFGVESGPRFSVKVIKDDKTIEDLKTILKYLKNKGDIKK